MRIALLCGLGVLGACTAPNPAFGDGAEATGGASESTKSEATTDRPASESTQTSSDASDASDSNDASDATSAGSGTASSSSSTTANDVSTSDDDDDTGTTSGFAESSTGAASGAILLFAAGVPNGNLLEDKGADPADLGVTQCAATLEDLAIDICNGPIFPVLRIGAALAIPAAIGNADAAVVSINGDIIATTPGDFFEGTWVVGALYDAGGGGLEELGDGVPVITGGTGNIHSNCMGWSTLEGEMNTAVVEGGDNWLEGQALDCDIGALILCMCST